MTDQDLHRAQAILAAHGVSDAKRDEITRLIIDYWRDEA